MVKRLGSLQRRVASRLTLYSDNNENFHRGVYTVKPGFHQIGLARRYVSPAQPGFCRRKIRTEISFETAGISRRHNFGSGQMSVKAEPHQTELARRHMRICRRIKCRSLQRLRRGELFDSNKLGSDVSTCRLGYFSSEIFADDKIFLLGY